ncbi:MAG: TadE/TadG family type IV pilus assembly protein [Gemmatimonadota bacterium]
MPSERGNNCRRIRRNSSGQSLVEFALVLPMLLLVFFGIFEFGRFYFTKLTLQHAVREATRFAITGNVLTDPDTGDPMDRAGSIVRVILENTKDLDVDLDGITITPADGGGPEDIVRVEIDFEYDLTVPLISRVVPDGHVDLSFSTAMRNEAFYE